MSQTLIWVSICGSLATAAIAAFHWDKKNQSVIIGLGLIPVMIRLIKSNINFAKRAQWNKNYLIDLEELYHTYEQKDNEEIAKKYFELKRKKEKEWNDKSL